MPQEHTNLNIDHATGEILENTAHTPQVLQTQQLVIDNSFPTDDEASNADLVEPFQPTLTGRIEQHKAGRKSKLTPRFIKQFEVLLLLGNYPDRICDMKGISRQTYYRWLLAGREIDEQFEELLEGDMFDLELPEDRLSAVEYLGYDRLQILKYDFFRMVKHAEAEAEGRLASIVFKTAQIDPYLALKLLETRFGQRWGKKRLEITGADGGPIEMETTKATGDMTPDEVGDELAKILARGEVRRLQAGGE
jgi:hypothetical protein